MTGEQGARTYAAFAAVVLIGGSNFIAVSLSNRELAPLFGATVRFALAGALFLVLARVMRVPLARGRAAAGAALYGVLGVGAAYGLLYYSLTGLNAGTAAIIVATVPLFTLTIAVLTGQERFTLRGLSGGVLAIAGIAVLSLGTGGGAAAPSYVVAAALGSVGIAASSVVAKAHSHVHPLNMNAIGMMAGTVMLAVGSLALREPWLLPRAPQTAVAIGWLVLFGSIGLFQLYLYVIRRWTASATVYAIAAMPLVAVLLGAIMLDQPITLQVLAGGAFVLLAVYVGAIAPARAAHAASSASVSRATAAPDG
jgi:drug/metabolite transporter (DMT)-like permease